MANPPKLKKSKESTSLHSRAAKRASSPSLNRDKSLTATKAPEEQPAHETSFLKAKHGAGITKRKPKAKPKSRQQRLRQEKGVAKAEKVIDRTEKKVAKSLDKGKTLKERSSAWEDINPRVSGGKRKQKDKKTLLVDVENEELEEANVVGRNPGTIPIEMEVEPVEATPQCGG